MTSVESQQRQARARGLSGLDDMTLTGSYRDMLELAAPSAMGPRHWRARKLSEAQRVLASTR